MSKKFILAFIVILIIIIVGIGYFLYRHQYSQSNIQKYVNSSQTSNIAFYPIHEIKSNNFNSGNYMTQGYVVKNYTCPPCPKGAQCKACMKNNIVISENNKPLENYSLSNKEMILFVNNPNQFELGKKYNFSIRIINFKSTSEPLNDVEIMSYTSI